MTKRLNQRNYISFFKRRHQELYSFIIIRVGYDKELAEDLTQEIFLKVWRQRESFDSTKATLRTWAYIIARRTLIDHFRKDKKKKYSVNIEDHPEISSKENLSKRLGDEIDVVNALKTLTSAEQDLIHLKYEQGFKIREIAQILNKTESAVKTSLHRVIKKLRKELDG